MTRIDAMLGALKAQKEMFLRSTGALEEADSGFAPAEGMFTVAQHVAHVANSLDWFVEGAFEREDGPDTDFEAHQRATQKVGSLTEAREWIDRAWANAMKKIGELPESELDAPIPGEILGGAPKCMMVDMNGDHVAHHRGALTVYARMLGKTPPMPYA